MATETQRPSAKILQFPSARRVDAAAQHDAVKQKSDRAAASAYAPGFGEAWYHEAAIRELVPGRQ